MKKTFYCLLLVVALFLVVGCGNETVPTTETPTTVTDAPTVAPTQPTEAPTEAPTEKPTEAPTEKPTEAPTEPEVTYTVKWEVNGAVVETDLEVKSGATPSYDGAAPTKESTAEFTYTFKAWSPEVASVTQDVTYVAEFTEVKNSYTVTWAVEGVAAKTDKVEYGTVPTLPEAPDKVATAEFTYTFTGWDKEVVAVTGDVTYNAQFTTEKNKYSITWKVDGQDDVVNLVEYGTTPSYGEANPTKAETAEFTYTFSKWDKDVVNVVADAVYTAEFASAKKSYNITWKVEGLEDKVESVEYGVTPTYSGTTPTKASTAEYSYAFSGWTPEVVAVVENATYTAVFTETKVKYSITWKVDGQDDVVNLVEYGATPSYGEANPTKASTEEYKYTFSGWTPEVVAVVGNATYTAEFTETALPITVTFTAEDDSVLFTREVAKGSELKDIPVAPSKKGYKAAWDTTDFTNITAAKTVKVVYTLATNNVYIANYTAQAGASVTVQVVVSGDVNFCAYEMTISYGTGLTLTSAKNVSGNGISNTFNTSVAGQVSATYSSTVNKTGEVAIIELVFTVSSTATVGDSYAISVTSAEFNTVDASYNASIAEYFVINGKVVVVE